VQSAVQAMKNGAYDYVTKAFSLDELKLLLDRVASHLKLKTENRILREKIKSKQGFGEHHRTLTRDGTALPHCREGSP
jgi:DNA-binding NtrC family response regulator